MPRKPANLVLKMPSDHNVGDDAANGVASQLNKFKEAARQLGTDDDPERFKNSMRKISLALPRKRPLKPVDE